MSAHQAIEDVAPPPAEQGPVPDYAQDNPAEVVFAPPTTAEKRDAAIAAEPAEPPEGWDRVDFNVIPEEHRKLFENRFNRLYYQLKQGQRERGEERKFYQGLESKLETFINSEQEARQQSKIELMSERAKKLFSDGEHEEGIEQLKKIVRAERELTAKAATAPVQKTAESPIAAFTNEEKTYLADFVQKNEWAGIASPHHGLTRTTLSRFLASGIPLREAVDATHEIMTEMVSKANEASGQPQASELGAIAQAVLGQNRGGQVAQERGPVLNEYEQAVARRFFPQLKADDAYARYLRGKKGG